MPGPVSLAPPVSPPLASPLPSLAPLVVGVPLSPPVVPVELVAVVVPAVVPPPVLASVPVSVLSGPQARPAQKRMKSDGESRQTMVAHARFVHCPVAGHPGARARA